MKKLIITVMAALLIMSCSTGAGLTGSSAAPPEFYGCKTLAEGEVDFIFSREVNVSSIYFDPPMEAEILSQGETVKVSFKAALPGGSKITTDILVEDTNKNTLNVLVSFRTRNDRVPDLVINEIRTAYSKPRVEFVEFKALSAGNLGALRLFAAYAREEPIYEFPPVEVKKGEYIVVHTRSIEDGLVDELGTNLAASKGTDALITARDLWIPGSTKLLHDTNAIYIMDQDDKIIDGVLLFSGNYKWKDSVAAAAREMARQGVWSGSEPEDAVKADGNTATRTINRIETRKNSFSAADWYITVTSGATPGKANNPNRYVR
ncbi:MAG: hypothetical protein LBH07_08285 [Treponema sp.]|nr:hypothetical protein [Treponema sp.]